MIHNAFVTSEIARRYYEKKTGEKLSRSQAANRWRMTKLPDVSILKEVFKEVMNEQKELYKKAYAT